jgi:Mrp family chromosome partitioning ATPase
VIGFRNRRTEPELGLFASVRIREEFYRIAEKLLRTNEARPKSIVVVGPKGGEGVTTIALNMAYAIASQENLRTLLVDANLRRPSIHIAAGVPVAPGITDYQAGSDLPVQAVTALCSNLSVLTAGSKHADTPWEQLALLLPDISQKAETAFDVVIWDASPIGEYPEALSFLRVARRAVLVAESDRTTLTSIAYAREQIAVAGADLLGVVLNRRGRFIPRWFAR